MTQRDHESEKKVTFKSGAQASKIDERYDLICPAGLKRLAARYALGASKYTDYSWCMGIPVSVRLNHLIKHLQAYLANGNEGDDNMAAIAWNAFAIMHYEEGCKHHEVFQHPQKEEGENSSKWVCASCKNSFLLNEPACITGDGHTICRRCKTMLLGGESID